MRDYEQEMKVVRRRLQSFRVLKYGMVGTIAGMAMSLLVLGAGRIWPIDHLLLFVIGISAAGVLAGALSGLLRRVTIQEAASRMDASTAAGEERTDMMVTALSFASQDSPAANWQREQAKRYAREFIAQLKARLPMPSMRRSAITAASLAAVILLLLLIPNPMDAQIAEAKEKQEWVKEQKEKVEELAKELEAKQLDPIAKAPLNKELDELLHALDKEKNPDQALEKIEESMKELEKTAKQQEEKAKALEQLAERMKQMAQLSKLAEQMMNNQAAMLEQAMKELSQQLTKMSDKQKDELREALNKLGEEAADHPEAKELQESLKQLASALSQDDQQQQEALKELQEKLAEAMAAKAASSDQADEASSLSSALASQGISLADLMKASGMKVSDTWSSGGSAEALAQAEDMDWDDLELSSSEGSTSSAQPSSGSGQGSGSGSGQGNGSGSGQGSGSGSGQGGSGSGSGSGSGAGFGIGNRDMVTTPRTMEGEGQVHGDMGPLQGTGGQIQKGGSSPILDGASRPYDEVYEEYAAEAKRSLGRTDLPRQMQGLVESYFVEINPNP